MSHTESERVVDAEVAVERLRTALRDAGIVLPSLRVDPVTAVRGTRFALVDLGRCNVRVASELAAALRGPGEGPA